ncbi:MAG: hypothetical protein WKF97_19620 [Chitinophagaceae bacterium]
MITFTFEKTHYDALIEKVDTGNGTQYHVTIDNPLLVERFGAEHIFIKDPIENLIHKGELVNGKDFTESLRQALDEQLPFLDSVKSADVRL